MDKIGRGIEFAAGSLTRTHKEHEVNFGGWSAMAAMGALGTLFAVNINAKMPRLTNLGLAMTLSGAHIFDAVSEQEAQNLRGMKVLPLINSALVTVTALGLVQCFKSFGGGYSKGALNRIVGGIGSLVPTAIGGLTGLFAYARTPISVNKGGKSLLKYHFDFPEEPSRLERDKLAYVVAGQQGDDRESWPLQPNDPDEETY